VIAVECKEPGERAAAGLTTLSIRRYRPADMTKSRSFGPVVAFAAALWLAVIGCETGPSRQAPRPAPAEAGSRMPPADAKAVFYKFGPPDSKVAFTGAKLTGKHEGTFNSFEGTIGLVNGDPLMSAVQVSIDLGSLTIQPPKLATHLKGADFFDVAKFPKATFSSMTIRPNGEPSKYNVTGRLDLHGVNKPLTFPATIRTTSDAVEAEAEITINRKDYGIVYPGKPDDLISDDVIIKLSIVARPSKAAPPTNQGASAADARSAD
jgi:polyisoprenoid-binding protein YceI